MSTERSKTRKAGPFLRLAFSGSNLNSTKIYGSNLLRYLKQKKRKIQAAKLNFSQAQLRLKLRRSCKVDMMSTEKARGKGATQAPFKTQPKGENLHIVASCRGAEIFSFLGWQEGVQDFFVRRTHILDYQKISLCRTNQ